ncbi:hypothetical protein FKD04_25060, partial [Salmonella enterica]|nr:hypothetical protein [Salmonella enterica]
MTVCSELQTSCGKTLPDRDECFLNHTFFIPGENIMSGNTDKKEANYFNLNINGLGYISNVR